MMESEYNAIQHLISESSWDARTDFDEVALGTSKIFESYEQVALLIDESAHCKRGKDYAGVSRQYCSTTGKVDNCQVAVYAALSTDQYYGLIDTALYLPQEWISDEARCKKAGIPASPQKDAVRLYKSKVELALGIVKHQLEIGTRFHFVGADGLYGNSYRFQSELDKLNLFFVLDIHCSQLVYTEPPVIGVPGKKAASGSYPKLYKASGELIEIKQLAKNIVKEDWEKICLKQPWKEDINCFGYIKKVYIWDGKSPDYGERMLVIRVTENKDGSKEYKYAVSNSKANQYTTEVLIRMLSQRYFVKHAFHQVQQEAGISQYQVEGWLAWHHHMAMVMMSLFSLLDQEILLKNSLQLLNNYEVRKILLNRNFSKRTVQQEIMQQILKKHELQRSKNNQKKSL